MKISGLMNARAIRVSTTYRRVRRTFSRVGSGVVGRLAGAAVPVVSGWALTDVDISALSLTQHEGRRLQRSARLPLLDLVPVPEEPEHGQAEQHEEEREH